MKKTSVIILTIIAFALSVFMLILLIGVSGKIDELSFKLTETQNTLMNRITALESFIQASKIEEESILSSYDFEYINEDYENRTVTVKIIASAKEYTVNTQAFALLNGTEIPMTLDSNIFTAEIEASFADEFEITQFILKDGDSIRTEALDLVISPRCSYLPQIFCEFAGSYNATLEKDIPQIELTGEAMAEIYCENDIPSITKAELLISINGSEVKRIPLDKDSKTETAFPVYFSTQTHIDETYDVKYGDVITLSIEAVDSENWKYSSPVTELVLESEGFISERAPEAYNITTIYNEKGEEINCDTLYIYAH